MVTSKGLMQYPAVEVIDGEAMIAHEFTHVLFCQTATRCSPKALLSIGRTVLPVRRRHKFIV
jgi:hypothetical protein